MKVILVKPYGYCAGVANAIELAKKVKKEHPTSNVIVLGMLVHNNDALMELSIHGISSLYKKDKSYLELAKELKDDDIVILTAHGHDKKIEDYLNSRGIKFFDATCPFVKITHQKIEDYLKDNHEVIYIGKANHPEAIAALSLSSKIHLYDINNGLDYSSINDKSPLVINQTTFSNREIKHIEEEILSKIKSAKVSNSVCNASSLRQDGLLSLPKEVELIYVIGGPLSNNTKTLFNLAKDNFPLSKVINIENKNDINKKDLLGLNYVALVSGASTPIYITDEIKDYLESLD